MDIKAKNLKGQIMIMKTLGMKPNYTEIGRSFSVVNKRKTPLFCLKYGKNKGI